MKRKAIYYKDSKGRLVKSRQVSSIIERDVALDVMSHIPIYMDDAVMDHRLQSPVWDLESIRDLLFQYCRRTLTDESS